MFNKYPLEKNKYETYCQMFASMFINMTFTEVYFFIKTYHATKKQKMISQECQEFETF